MKLTGLPLLAFVALLYVNATLAAKPAIPFDPIDPAKMVEESSVFVEGNPAWTFKTYVHPRGTPGSNKYVRSDATADFKTALLFPTITGPGDRLKIREHFDGYTANPTNFPDWYQGVPGYVTIKTHPGHYPKIDDYQGAMDMGAFANGGLSNMWRYGVGVAKIYEIMGDNIDWDAGILFDGNSWGGMASMLQSFMVADPEVQKRVTIVNALVPDTLITRDFQLTGPNPTRRGYALYNYDAVSRAWSGPNNYADADILTHTHLIKNVFYALNGNSTDTSTYFNLEVFDLLCRDHKIACFGTWRGGDHYDDDGIAQGYAVPRVDNKIPQGLPRADTFSGPDDDSRLDRILPIFTNSTANHRVGPRGHYNLGMEWNSAAQVTNQPTASSLTFPIRYRRHTNFGHGCIYDATHTCTGPDLDPSRSIPDQPLTSTFTLTLRKTGAFRLPVGTVVNYSLPAHGSSPAIPAQAGKVTVDVANEVTIPKLTLRSQDTGYQNLTLTQVKSAPAH